MFTCGGCLSRLINCTLTNNMFRALYSNFGTISMSGSVVWGNTFGSASGLSTVWNEQGTFAVDYSCIQGWDGSWGGLGNTGTDPLFVDPLGPDGIAGTLDDDLRLSLDSPLINAGDPGFVPDPGVTDLDGDPRLQGCRIDMGAYESDVTQALGDFDGNESFDLADLAGFQLCINPSVSNPAWLDACLCVFDYDKDDQIDLSDFADFQHTFTGDE